jgi:hypothetical protein
MQAVNGYYDGGFALLCTTNYRVLVVDKKPFLLTVEDLRYDMIAEVDYSSRILTAVLHIYTPLRTLMFASWSMTRLRKSMSYIQQRVMELRNNDYLASQFATASAQKAPAIPAPQPKTTHRKKLFPMRQDKQPMPQMEPTYQQDMYQAAEPVSYAPEPPIQEATSQESIATPQPYQATRQLVNPYTKVPLLARRRKYPSFY